MSATRSRREPIAPTVRYVANARLPTEKAHGLQISKMCEAMGDLGLGVTLLHPRRRQPVALRGRALHDYYGVRRTFRAVELSDVDLVGIFAGSPPAAHQAVYALHSLCWSLYAVRAALTLGGDLFYTRDADVALWLTLAGAPTVYEAHVVLGPMRRSLLRLTLRRPSLRLVVALTSYIERSLVELGAPASRVIVAPDAVDLDLFRDDTNRAGHRARLGLPSERPIVGYVGRFNTMGEEKGLPDLIRAVGRLSQSQEAPMLVCVGGPMDAADRYRALAASAGLPADALVLVDRVPPSSVPAWLRAFDVAVAPFPDTPHYAYFMSPLKVFEYMASETPIVATDLPSLREVLRDDENALLTAPGDVAALAQAIGLLLTDRPRGQRLAAAARRDVENHTWRTRVTAVLSRAGLLECAP